VAVDVALGAQQRDEHARRDAATRRQHLDTIADVVGAANMPVPTPFSRIRYANAGDGPV